LSMLDAIKRASISALRRTGIDTHANLELCDYLFVPEELSGALQSGNTWPAST